MEGVGRTPLPVHEVGRDVERVDGVGDQAVDVEGAFLLGGNAAALVVDVGALHAGVILVALVSFVLNLWRKHRENEPQG